ncbi:hypothetical protein SV7mr_44150 [Stieleria bergensis]|uniref:Uncharacterized protein n=2 Tax=Stieleria bergensis TaxID=2528025 RepID=A0A517T0F4_9BACT|nr:hypothetical protein SV7mr_44150 [Planctomycetes bacterium SV_7m_r]
MARRGWFFSPVDSNSDDSSDHARRQFAVWRESVTSFAQGWDQTMDSRWYTDGDMDSPASVPMPGHQLAPRPVPRPTARDPWPDSVASQITANGNIASSINHDLALREHWLWQMEQYRQQTHQHYARYYQQAMETMAAQLRGLRQQLNEVPASDPELLRSLQQRLADLEIQLQAAKQKEDQAAARSEYLRSELEHAQASAVADREQLIDCQKQTLQTMQEKLDRLKAKIDPLQRQAKESLSVHLNWQVAHDQAVSLCEHLQDVRGNDQQQIDSLQSELDSVYQSFTEEQTAWHQQLRQLQAKVVALQVQDQRQLLQIDDLDHLIDDLNSQQQSLQQELESVCRQYSLEHQELRQLVAVTDQELSDCRIRLGAESEEKVSLMRSLALTTVSERQLRQSNEQLKQQRDLAESQLADQVALAIKAQRELELQTVYSDRARTEIAESVHENRSLQALLAEASERTAEQQLQIESQDSHLQALKADFDEHQEQAARTKQQLEALIDHQSEAHQGKVAELEHQNKAAQSELQKNADAMQELQAELVSSGLIALQAAEQNDQLQHRMTDAQQQIDALQALTDGLKQKTDQQDSELAKQYQDQQTKSELIGKLKSDLSHTDDRWAEAQSRVEELEAYVSQLAEQSNEADEINRDDDGSIREAVHAEVAQQWQRQVNELQVQLLQSREREQLAAHSTISAADSAALQQQAEAENVTLKLQLDEANELIQQLQLQLAEDDQDDHAAEARRLSDALAKQTANYQAERQAYQERIDQLLQLQYPRHAAA